MTCLRLRCVGLAVIFGLTIGGCSDEIVYRDLPDFEDPPAGALGFLGYSDAPSNRTTCGNCHSGKQAQWENTAHAHAWQSLASSGAAAKSCESCHSVSDRGNVSTDPSAGYVSTQSPRYQDVQCESCHGPGLTHVTNPDVTGNKPLASLAVGTSLTNGCGECHSGDHQPFAEQWASSRHANAPGTRGTNASCWSCHDAKKVLESWGINSNYVEASNADAHLPVVCTVCHDPHNAKNPNQLRFPIDVPDVETNLCMKCHHKRAEPEINSNRGPHSPQGPILLGEGGWLPPNFQYPPKSLVGTHGSDQNPKLCATCHVAAYDVPDKLTGQFSFRATGHSFQPIPCVDGNGVPLPDPKADCDDTERSFRACVGCHGSETAARSARAVAKLRLTRLADDLDALLDQLAGTSAFNYTDGVTSTAEGSRFNEGLARERGSAIHNPFLVEALLLASIRQVELDYGLSARSTTSFRSMLTPPPQLRAK